LEIDVLKLTDDQWSSLREMATPIPVHLRSDYLSAVASTLAGVPDPGDGEIHRAARTAQQKILYGPRSNGGDVLDGKTGLPLTPRQHAEAMGIKEAPNNGESVTIVGARPAKW
jgi:hypothetical protein